MVRRMNSSRGLCGYVRPPQQFGPWLERCMKDRDAEVKLD